MKPLSVPERLTKNRFNLDEQESHIEVDQEIAKATGTGKAIVACCPAHVYCEEPDGTISVEYAACLECRTCLAIACPWRAEMALSPRRVRRPVPRGVGARASPPCSSGCSRGGSVVRSVVCLRSSAEVQGSGSD